MVVEVAWVGGGFDVPSIVAAVMGGGAIGVEAMEVEAVGSEEEVMEVGMMVI